MAKLLNYITGPRLFSAISSSPYQITNYSANVFESLPNYGVNVNVTNKIFDIVRQRQKAQFEEAFLKERVNVKEQNSGMTVLDVAVESESRDCLDVILLHDLGEVILLDSLQHTLNKLGISVGYFSGQYRLYRSIMLNLTEQFDDFVSVEVVNLPWCLTGESFLECCVRFNRKDMVVAMMPMMLWQQEQALNKALDIAQARSLVKTADVIRQRKEVLRIQELALYSRLHGAIKDNRVDVVRFLLQKQLVDINQSNHAVGNPLCFAFYLGYGDCVQALLEYGVNVNVTNKYNQTPLHIAIESGMGQFSAMIINKTDNVDKRDCFQYTALHHATINKDDGLCGLLLTKGANLCNPLKIGEGEPRDQRLVATFFPLLAREDSVTLSLKLHRTIMPSLMDHITHDNVHSLSEDGSTFLHLAARLLLSQICIRLIDTGANVNLQNSEGNTPILSLFQESFQNSWQNNLDSPIEDYFTLYHKQWPDVLETMLSLQNPEFTKGLIVHIVERGLDEFMDFVLERFSAEFTENVIEDCLYNSARVDNEIIFNKFKVMNLRETKWFPCGHTVLTRLIKDNNIKYSLILAKSKLGSIFNNAPNQTGQTPLYLAADMGSLKLCKRLVIEAHSIDYEDKNKETAMERLFRSSTNTADETKLKKVEMIVKVMIKAGLDINRLNKTKNKAIEFCQNFLLRSKLESFQKMCLEINPRLSVNLDEEKNICEICLLEHINCQFGCGHPFCRTCANKFTFCPTCRGPKTKIIPLYIL